LILANISFENVAQFKYWGTTVTSQNLNQEEIKRTLNLGHACCYSVQNRLSSRLLSKSIGIRVHKTIILPVVLYGRETLSLTLREGHRLRVFENRFLRRIFGPKRDEVTRDLRNLHNEELLHNLYSSSNIIRVTKSRRMRWEGHVAPIGKRNEYMVLMGNPEGKRPGGRPRSKWMDNIRMDLREIGWSNMNWIDLAQDRKGGGLL
jgi:hypothetical protein